MSLRLCAQAFIRAQSGNNRRVNATIWTRTSAVGRLKSQWQKPLVDMVPADCSKEMVPAYPRSDADRRAFWVGFMFDPRKI